MKSTAFHRISLKATGFHYGFHCGFHSSKICNEIHNEIHSEIHNEILLILVKSVEFNDIQKWHEKHLKSEKHNCSWKAQVLFMKNTTVHEKCRCFSWKAQLFMKSAGAFHEKRNCSWKVQVLFMKSAAFHTKDHLQGIVTLCLILCFKCQVGNMSNNYFHIMYYLPRD